MNVILKRTGKASTWILIVLVAALLAVELWKLIFGSSWPFGTEPPAPPPPPPAAVGEPFGSELATLNVESDKDKPQGSIYEQIRKEATSRNIGEFGRALPLLASWNTGEAPNTFDPAWQFGMIEKGHYLLPWFHMPKLTYDIHDPWWLDYYKPMIEKAARLKLPISFVSTQWEILFVTESQFTSLPPDKSPNSLNLDGTIRTELDPLGPVEPWRQAGSLWAASPFMKKLQQWYPDPPAVFFISNNEHPKLEWPNAEKTKRYMDAYGAGRDPDFKRKLFGDGWIERQKAMIAGLRDSLASETWKTSAKFIGYNAFGPSHFARWPQWPEYSLYTTGRIDPNPLIWDGGSPPFYTHNWDQSTDFTLWSPQVEGMNWIFMLQEAYKTNPEFWFEISTWDGHVDQKDDKRKFYESLGQVASPERYGGMAQYGMWLLRPRTIRDFRGYLEPRPETEPYFAPLMDAVDRVHKNETLRAFWRRGTLVVNPTKEHPYRNVIPEEYENIGRWYRLDTSLDPPHYGWSLGTQFKVFSLALVMGSEGNRSWLIYAHAPLGEQKAVDIALPGYGKVTVDVPLAGGFWQVDEPTQKVTPIR